jgi:outer membrane protein assembly factor BamB
MRFSLPTTQANRWPRGRAARRRAWLAIGLLLGAGTLAATAADWPQWRGPRRDGVSRETGWQWPAGGPRRLWSVQVGEGFSSVAVAKGRLYTMGNRNGQEIVSCLNAANGRLIWSHRYRCPAGDYGGPRATPTVDGDRVYTLSREGQAFCLDALTGRPIWGTDLRRETGAETPRWGFAGSPLVSGNLVIYNVGAAGTAVDRQTGRVVWRSGRATAGYASPVAGAISGQPFVAIFAASELVGVEPATGRSLWRHPWQTSYDVNAADPIVWGDTVFISSNYNKGGALLRVGSGAPKVLWQNRAMRNHANSCVLVNGHLYGNDENTLKCVDIRTGTERWRRRGIGKGGLIAADGRLLVLTERGLLLLVQATPERCVELAQAEVLSGTCWTHPVLANGLLYCRSQEGELVGLDLRAKGDSRLTAPGPQQRRTGVPSPRG